MIRKEVLETNFFFTSAQIFLEQVLSLVFIYLFTNFVKTFNGFKTQETKILNRCKLSKMVQNIYRLETGKQELMLAAKARKK